MRTNKKQPKNRNNYSINIVHQKENLTSIKNANLYKSKTNNNNNNKNKQNDLNELKKEENKEENKEKNIDKKKGRK